MNKSQIEQDLGNIKRFLGGTLVILLFIFLLFWFKFIRPIQIEEYCDKKATVDLGDQFNILVEPTEEEKRLYPEITQITLGFREILRCQKDQKFFYLF